EDLPVLLDFEQGIIAAERPFDKNLKPEKISYYDLNDYITRDDVEVLVAVDGDKVIASGYAKIRPSKDFMQEEQHSYLGFMYVLPEYRGYGINQMIVEELIMWSQQQRLSVIYLEVYHGNQPALNAYQKAGFQPFITEMRLNLDD
ncbi:MAG: GNAT family N-acetyltransferase, partial [Gammaproteobacteria bacterium]|nr:GNAT family N-acetyltransferase [Gammaproteobacteria bacterium]